MGAAGIIFASATDNLSGYAWSENIGWINFNGADYGVTVASTGAISGYAWSSNLGWISFNSSELTGCPFGGTCNAHFDNTTGAVTGWARALAGVGGGGWDGWISLSGTNYGVTATGCNWGGYAWGSDIIGWIHFRALDGTAYGVTGTGQACVGEAPPPSNLPINEPCGANLECTSGYCDPATNTCQLAPNGGSCTLNRSCSSGYCDPSNNTCQTLQQHSECSQNACVTVSGAGADTCFADAECAGVGANQHAECVSNACTIVAGAGSNLCSSTESCGGGGGGGAGGGQQTSAICGNGVCETGENASTCLVDCGAVPPAGPTETTDALCTDGIDNDSNGSCDYAGCAVGDATLPADPNCPAQVINGGVTLTFTVVPQSGTAPTSQSGINSTLTAALTGGEGTINYSFWWNCANTSADVAAAISACGNPDAKYDNILDTSKSVTHEYLAGAGGTVGNYIAKVIIERGDAKIEARKSVTVQPSPQSFTLQKSNDIDVTVTTSNISQDTTISIVPINDFSGSVALSWAGNPTLVRCDTKKCTVSSTVPVAAHVFAPITLTKSGGSYNVSDLTLTISSGADPGIYKVTVIGTGTGNSGAVTSRVDVYILVKEIRPEFKEI